MLETSFADATILPAAPLRELQVRRDGPGLQRLVAQTTAYVGSAAAMMLVSDPIAWWVLLLLHGLTQFGMFGMLHEACHKTAFEKPGLSEVAGWVAALAQPMSPALMRAFHFEHHRHTHQLDRDPELAGMEMMVGWPRGVMWLVTMTGIPVLVARVGWAMFAALVPSGPAWDKVLPFVRPARRRRIAWEARVLLAIHGGVMVTAALWYPPLWQLYLGMLVGHSLLSWYITCEHRGLDPGGTIFERTRSLRVPAFVRWLLWNMPYHAEHHAWPAIPFHALPDTHREVRPHLVHEVSPLTVHLRRGRA